MPVNDDFARVLDGQMSLLTSSSIDQMWERAKAEFFGEWEALTRQGLDQAEIARRLESFMDDLSLKPIDDLARQSSTVAYNQGRGASQLTAEAEGEAEFVVRSEILDTATCDPCALLDGEIFGIGTSEYFANMPPAQCDGGARCRGFYVAIGTEG